MKILFVCNTHFQCMVSVIIKMQHKEFVNADIIITDKMDDSGNLCKRLEETNLFDKVMHVNVLKYTIIKNDKLISKIWKTLIHYFFPEKITKSVCNDNIRYDLIFTHNIEALEDALFYEIQKKLSCKVFLYDEGYSSYTKKYIDEIIPANKKVILLRKMAKIIKKRKFMNSCIEGLYLLDKDLIVNKMPWDIYAIAKPELSDGLIDIFNKIFMPYNVMEEYPKKIIFFEECFSFDIDEGNNNDINTISYIGGIVGKENFMVKLHPRNKKNRFKKYGIFTNKTIGIPWEDIIINFTPNDKKVFITYSSGSVINYRLLFNLSFKTIMIFRCAFDGYHKVDEDAIRFFQIFQKKYPQNLLVPSNHKEFEDALKWAVMSK